jgi:hypothetical protein
VITESRDSHTMATVFAALGPLAALLWHHDGPTAYLLRVARRRMWAGPGSPLPAHALDALDPATIAELEEWANAMSADETVAFALEALERYVAAIDPR